MTEIEKILKEMDEWLRKEKEKIYDLGGEMPKWFSRVKEIKSSLYFILVTVPVTYNFTVDKEEEEYWSVFLKECLDFFKRIEAKAIKEMKPKVEEIRCSFQNTIKIVEELEEKFKGNICIESLIKRTRQLIGWYHQDAFENPYNFSKEEAPKDMNELLEKLQQNINYAFLENNVIMQETEVENKQ